MGTRRPRTAIGAAEQALMLLAIVLAVVAGVIVALLVWTVGEWLERISQL